MATVSNWNPYGVALDITATAAGTVTRTTATQYTVVIDVSWKTYYSGAQTNYGMSATSGGVTKVISSFGTKRSSGSGSFTGTYSISGNGSATKTITVTFKNFNEDTGASSSKNVTFNVTVPAWTSYTVKYNANGGTGAPSSQTKWKDQTLTLSTTKPTRTGYSFQGWSTSSGGVKVYDAGGTLPSHINTNITLYAVWKANTYTVTYNANGGTGAPSSQTKTYDVTLTLSTTKPTRTNYNFKGWGTSASATTVSYDPGDNYTANSAITLYAIWELAYTKPRITNLSVKRGEDCPDIAQVSFNWVTDQSASKLVLVWSSADESYTHTETFSDNQTWGSLSIVLGAELIDNGYYGRLDINKTYTVSITLTDTGGSTTVKRTVAGQKYAFHAMPEAKGVAFGKPAEIEDYLDCGYNARFRNHINMENHKMIFGRDTEGNLYAGLEPVTEAGNTSLGYGLYYAGKGYTEICGNKVVFRTNNGIYTNGNKLYFNNAEQIYGTKPDGSYSEAFVPSNVNGNVVIGYGNYQNKDGSTNIYGYDVNLGVSNMTTPGYFRPYRRKGDSISLSLRTAGYVTNSGTDVSFWIPMAVAIIGSPTVTLTSGNGFIFRQGANYTHGSTATSYVTPTSCEATATAFCGIYVKAVFSDTTDVINNDSIGIYWNGTITFS